MSNYVISIMECNIKAAFERIIPVNPPTVKRKINPIVNNMAASTRSTPPQSVAIQLNTLIPVGTAIIIVAAVK